MSTATDSILDQRLAEELSRHRQSDGRYCPPLVGDRLMGPEEFARYIVDRLFLDRSLAQEIVRRLNE